MATACEKVKKHLELAKIQLNILLADRSKPLDLLEVQELVIEIIVLKNQLVDDRTWWNAVLLHWMWDNTRYGGQSLTSPHYAYKYTYMIVDVVDYVKPYDASLCLECTIVAQHAVD